MWTKFVNWLCWKIVESFPNRTKTIYIDDDPYLLRFFIKHSGRLPGMYLHHFFRGDNDRDLHDHPWKLSGSLILTGGYVEERLVDLEAWMNYPTREALAVARPGGKQGLVIKRYVGPGTINIIRGDDFHRVDLVGDSAWTIFVSGNKNKDWGFWERDTGRVIPHREYLKEKGRPFLEEG